MFEGRPFFYVFVGLDQSVLARAAGKSLAVNLGVLALTINVLGSS